MLALEFEFDDLAQIRFAVSPIAETVYALRLPSGRATSSTPRASTSTPCDS